MSAARRYLSYLSMRAKVGVAYRGDFLLHLAGDALVSGIGAVFLWAVFTHVPHIRGWTLYEVLFVWGLAEVCTGVFFAAFQGLWSLNQRYLLRGEFDRVLLRPLDPYTQVLLDNVNPSQLSVAAVGVAMLAVAVSGLPPLGLGGWLALPVFVLGGVATLAGVLTLVSAAGFRVHHRGTAVGLVYQASVFNRYPLDIFDQRIRLALTWVLPFGFVAYYPACWLLGRPEHAALGMAQPLVGLGVFALGQWVWRRAAAGYRSTGS